MALTLLLLGALYVVLVAVLVAAGAGVVTVAVIAAALFLAQYFTSDRIALAAIGAREVDPHDGPAEQRLSALLDRLCLRADLPLPRVAIARTPMPNALTVGRSPSTATVCATTGLLALLDDAELEGVLAHELTHIANRDVMPITIASFFASIAAAIVLAGEHLGRLVTRGDRGADDDRPSLAVVALASGIVYLISYVLVATLSRYRELAADRGAAILTGRPSTLESALRRISGELERIPERDLPAASGELGAFLILPPPTHRTVATMFPTHPPLAARLAELARLEAAGGEGPTGGTGPEGPT